MHEKEEQLYEPILVALKKIFEEFIERHMEAPKTPIQEELHRLGSDISDKVHLEITAKGHFSEELKEAIAELDDKALGIIRVEKFSPDIMGFIQKDQFSKELITVEVKPDKITIKNISRAKLYADIFGAKYGMLISPKKIPVEIWRFISSRYAIRGNIIIAQFDKVDEKFIFHPKLYPTPPEPFKQASKD